MNLRLERPAGRRLEPLRAPARLLAAVAAFTLAGEALAGELVIAGTQPPPGDVPAGTVRTVVGRLSITATAGAGAVTVSGLRVANGATADPARPGSDVQSLQLWDDLDGNGSLGPADALLGSSTWSAGASRWVFGGLALPLAAGAPARTLLVTLNAAVGARPPRTFAMALSEADVLVAAPSTVRPFSAAGAVFTIRAGTAEGHAEAGSERPVVLIVNPAEGVAVTSDPAGSTGVGFRVQVKVYSPLALAGSPPSLSTDGGLSFGVPLAWNANYGGSATDGVYEATLRLDPGAYVLVARAGNAAGSATSGKIIVTVNPAASRRGDGNLLVRDNSSQLCTDCHALKAHSSQDTSNRYGAWAVSCRGCHTPHDTSNAYLIREEVTPPAVNGAQPSRRVYFSNRSGWAPDGGAAAPGAASYANADGSGPCQVCHTRTVRWKSDGVADTSHTGDCATCHAHAQGFRSDCSACHGDRARTPAAGADTLVTAAPPRDHLGNADPTFRGVGAHQAHVNRSASPIRATPVGCADCHPMPNTHQGTVDVAFGALANSAWGGLPAGAPTWDAAGATCASTYCHGNFKNGARASPSWTAGAAMTCQSCHGTPPGGNHPQNASCGSCHPGYSLTAANTATHVNGRLDVANLGCTSCHGTEGRASVAGADANQAAAPPVDSTGAPGGPAVGAHLAHVNKASSAIRRTPLACADCHLVPVQGDSTHADGSVAMLWGSLATTAWAGATPPTPAWDRSAGTCSSTYCHGSFKNGANAAPSWASTTGVSCQSCHGTPPGGTHPQNANCAACHPPGYTGTTADLDFHLDGRLDLSELTCSSCHGTTGRASVAGADLDQAAAPPLDSLGASTGRRVGAHLAHVNPGAGALTGPKACAECHDPKPTSTSHADGVVQIAFGALARQGGVAPVFASAGATCSSTYCHGNFPGGNGANAPAWEGGPAAGACGSCHTNPPSLAVNHPQNAACGTCHTGYTATGVDASRHVNGAVDVARLGCVACHGDPARPSIAGADPILQQAAPPIDATGGTAATTRGVGAHVAHVNQARLRGATVACSECHVVPLANDRSHANGTVAIAWGPLARNGTALSPAWNGTTCASTYCHGSTLRGGSVAAPSWTGGASQAQCGTCHGVPPPASIGHVQNASCGSCHPGYTSTSVNAAIHIDRTLDVAPLTCASCHGDAARAPVASATAADPLGGVLVRAAPPVDAGGTATGPRVGAHQAHVNRDAARNPPISCGECHGTAPAAYGTAHSNGTVEVAFGPLARTGNRTPVYTPATGTCASTYCHSGAAGGTAPSPSWGQTLGGCTACHGAPPDPAGTHAGVAASITACNQCHAESIDPAGNVLAGGKHLNGAVDGGESRGGQSCSSCHGGIWQAMNGATPKASRHALGNLVGTNDSATDLGTTWPGPGGLLTAIAPEQRSCVSMCHGDHTHDLTQPVVATHENNAYVDARTPASRAAGTRTSATRARSDFSAGTGGLCVSCHQSPVASGGLTVDAASYGGSAHDYVTNTVGTTTYVWAYTMHDGGVFERNCTKCHSDRNDSRPGDGSTPFGSVHFSDFADLLAGSKNPAGAPATFVCYNCHGNGTTGQNLSGKDIATQVAKTRGHPSNADSAHDSVAELSGAAFGNALGGRARHASCMDCHDTHKAKAGTHAVGTAVAGPPLEGAWGAQLSSNPAFWTAPAAANFTKKTIVAGTDLEATLCFKCHSSYYWGAATPPTNPSGGFPSTDQAREFNPANSGTWNTAGTLTSWASGETAGGFHPVLATAGSNLGAINVLNLTTTSFAWSRVAGTRNRMTCTDCHESNSAADPNGPHGSTASFLLRGPNTAWNNTITAGGTIPVGTFCLNCHANNYASSRFPGHTRGDHAIACQSCHAAVPHGGPRPGILVAAGGASTGVGGVIAGWDQTAPYRGVAATAPSKLYINSYPSSQSTGWVQSNCGCNGSAH